MAALLLWIPLMPLLSSLLLLLAGARLGERPVALLGVGSVALSALFSLAAILSFSASDGVAWGIETLPWFSALGLEVGFSLHFDGLSAVMVGVITGVGLLIHLYSVAYMAGDADFARFFAYLNLFVAMMLILVLAGDFLLLYLGWEGVGLCSFLLIGFWYRQPENGYAARKAFVVTRIGDVALALGLLILVQQFGMLNIQDSVDQARQLWPGSDLAGWVALLLLGGAVGKSAQLPLQTWLPDAMAGPTPVSALIHAATMVTAGVYLIARTQGIFMLAPQVLQLVALVGAMTLFLAACSALVQHDLKRILAYSTISQIGYMFFALGTGAFSAAVFHLMTHAFFKALLFLAAGQVIMSLHHEQDTRRMGGLLRPMPFSALCFAIGCAALAALPLTSGFYSKDAILLQAYAQGGAGFAWWLALAGALVTALYSLRLFVRLFLGDCRTLPEPDNRPLLCWPLGILCLLALFGALIPQPLHDVFSAAPQAHVPLPVHLLVLAMPVIGLVAGIWLLLRHRDWRQAFATGALARWWRAGWGFDVLYDWLLVRPLLWLARVNRRDLADLPVQLLVWTSRICHQGLSRLQSGRLRHYAVGIVGGAVLILAVVL
ncbi:NADH-quinone oxidoreductase subunit L [Marinobacterium nitratireducens]|uniref:NADH-quinone oxidoreductase subunit L n=1 Tax=Marinobacterium nitratireducens TaxID=518897 RepID=A0A918DP91_9GAMM|nr:NADH-quinone oxidoreductase subunit L [Marinobacterium nitratireducens]GGO78174.1 NADH-quinone oxidoreductase subunit L [Marinobacterium nitratireducens]